MREPIGGKRGHALSRHLCCIGGRGGEKRMYRWRDATGSWQYGRIPPPGVEVQTVDLKAPSVITAEEMRGEGPPAQEK
ncbi:MAG: DUF4124 domain-containing protein [Alcanivorax sp.]|nr:DUF4124 domain-containing protein [Alcanivorax sp.]